MRLSRLAWSPYETPADRRAEAELLGRRLSLVDAEADAEILVTPSNRRVDAALLASRPSARLVITTTSGHDHLDLDLLVSRGIAACRLPQVRRDAVVEVALGLVLQGLHALPALQARARRGLWARAELPDLGMQNLAGSRLGIIGLGVIGRRLAELARAMGVEVWGWDPAGLPPGVRAAPPGEMVEACAAISLHCGLTPSSRGILGEAELARARGLVLVNTARGEVLDLPAALAALDQGRLAFLGLDVFPVEPWPELAATLEGREGLVLLPHAAGYHQGLHAMVREGLDQAVAACLAGRELPYRLC